MSHVAYRLRMSKKKKVSRKVVDDCEQPVCAPTCSVAARCPGGAGPVQSEGCGPGCSERKADSAAPTPTACWPEDLPSDASHPAPAFKARRRESGP